jgi:ketosteroid isomerase-like protein
MSQETVEIVRALVARWEEGDYSSTSWADPGVEFVVQVPGSGTWQGVEAMRDSWVDFLRVWEEFEAVVQEVVEAGDQVLALVEFGGRGHESGVPITDLRGAALFTSEASKGVRLTFLTNPDKVRAAAGLRE